MRLYLTIFLSAFIFFSASESEAVRAPRSCTAAKTAIAKVKRYKSLALKYHSLYKRYRRAYLSARGPARTLQGPMVQKFSNHFKKPNIYTRWLNDKLRRNSFNFLRGKLKSFQRDLKKLKRKNINLKNLKSRGFKWTHHYNYNLDDEGAMAPCFKRNFGKKSKKLPRSFTRKFSTSKLRGMYNLHSFLKLINLAKLRDAIRKTNAALKHAKLARKYGRLARKYKGYMVAWNTRFKRHVRQCKRAVKRLKRLQRLKRIKLRRKRTSIDKQSSLYRRCGDNDTSTTSTWVCWECWNFEPSSSDTSESGSVDTLVTGGDLGSSFEGNFRTNEDQIGTDEAFNEGANTAVGATADAHSTTW